MDILPHSLANLLADPDLMQTIYEHVAGGGSLVGLCETWGVPFSTVMRIIRADKTKTKVYEQALVDRTEWVKERILSELRMISLCDITEIFGENNEVLNTDAWPDHMKANVQSIEVTETFETIDREKVFTGYVKKVKFHDKLKAADMVGKQMKLWNEMNTKDAVETLADLLALARDPELDKKIAESK